MIIIKKSVDVYVVADVKSATDESVVRSGRVVELG